MIRGGINAQISASRQRVKREGEGRLFFDMGEGGVGRGAGINLLVDLKEKRILFHQPLSQRGERRRGDVSMSV